MTENTGGLRVRAFALAVCGRGIRYGAALLVALTAILQSLGVVAQTPAYVATSPLTPLLTAMPEGSWRRVNVNQYQNVWTPDALRPLYNGGALPPSKIILAWSGFGWDSNRGDLILYGGGHANYPGNDVYRWRSSSLLWERASLPSEIWNDPVAGYQAIDGVDNAPSSAHTYDNNLFLPIADRFMTWGGAAFNNGGPYLRASETNPTQARATGPYLFDPTRADGNKVGGSTGSHVERDPAYSGVVGGRMWQNRDIVKNLPTQEKPGANTNGCTGYATENGRDVVYVAGTSTWGTNLDLYRYQLTSLASPTLDTIAKVGTFWSGPTGQTACAYDPSRKLFVRTGDGVAPLYFWDLTTPGPDNPDHAVDVNTSIAGLRTWLANARIGVGYCGLEYDPNRRTFLLWCGGGTMWELRPPTAGNTTAGWSATSLSPSTATVPPGESTGTGVLGKWRYAPYYDVFVGLEDINAGDIWIYKPRGWVAPNVAGNVLPQVAITAPLNGAIINGSVVSFTSSASDADGSVVRVEYYVDGARVGQATAAPYTFSYTTSVGLHSVVAIATDNAGGTKTSASVAFTTSTSTTPPTPSGSVTLQRGSGGYNGVSDTYLDAMYVTATHGAETLTYVDALYYKPMLRFAIFQSEGGPVPDGADIQSASLQIHKGYYDDTFSLRALLKPWSESLASASTNGLGAAWNAANTKGAGIDYEAAIDASGVGAFDPGWVSFDVTTRVQRWSDRLASNYGWRLEQAGSNTNFKQFESSDYTANTTLRPKLVISYTTSGGGTTPPTTPPANVAPTVALTSPVGGSSILLGEFFTLLATAADSDGTIASVEFFANGTQLGRTLAPPYVMTWAPSIPGSYALTAVATDNAGAKTTSAGAVVNVSTTSAGPNVAPSVAITSPVAGASIARGSAFTLRASASDLDGTVAKVEYYANQSKIGQSTVSPYTVTWTPPAAGGYTLVAVATDNLNATRSSTGVAVTVTTSGPTNNPPTVHLTDPSAGSVFGVGDTVNVAATALDSGGSIAKVEFYANQTKIGEATAPPYQVAWTPRSAGSVTLVAAATDNLGAMGSSASVAVTIVTSAATTKTLQAGQGGYLGATDTYLDFAHPNAAFGASTTLSLDANTTPLLRFAIFSNEGGPVPQGATIVSATLSMYKLAQAGGVRVNALLVPWREDQATLEVRQSGALWAAPGASVSGVDYAPTVDAQAVAAASEGWIALDVTDRVTDWSEGTAVNYGWRAARTDSAGGTMLFNAGNYATDPSRRPKLVVVYR